MLLAVPPPPLRAIDADASLLISIMEAGWPTIGRKERVALCHLLYAVNVLPYDGHDPTKQVVDSFVPFDALDDITPYLVALWIIVIGVSDGRGNTLSSGEVLDLSSKTWSPLAPMATRRQGHSAVRVDNAIIVIGGYDDRGKTLSSGEVLDLSSKTWSPLPPMTTQRRNFGISST